MSNANTQSFLIVADTNSLFTRDPAEIVSNGFMTAWAECGKFGNARLVLPEVVKGERLYQMFCAAQRSRENAEANIEVMAKIVGPMSIQLPDPAAIRRSIEQRFDGWSKEHGVEIIPVPFGRINWPRIVNDAIWRVSPFMPPGEHKDTEKGFRDCLIVETLAELVQSQTEQQVVFISRDRLLRDSSIARFEPVSFAAYEDLAGFLSYLELTHEQVQKAQNELIQRIIQKAPSVFFTQDDSKCLYIKENIGGLILRDFSVQLQLLPEPETGNSGGVSEGYVPVSEEKIFIDGTEYERSSSKAAWGWKTKLRCVRVFRSQSAEKNAAAELADDSPWSKIADIFAVNEIVRVAPFDVHWTARCDGEARFSRLKLVEATPLPHSREIGFFKLKYGFKPNKPG